MADRWRHSLGSLERRTRPLSYRQTPRIEPCRSSSSDTSLHKRSSEEEASPAVKRTRYTPKPPIPRRPLHALPLAPRSPSSPFFAIPRKPGGSWPRPTPSSPPTILVSPPDSDMAAIMARCARPSTDATWQRAFVRTLLTRDQLAFDKLAWQLDLVFAKLAATLNCDVAGLAKHAARQTIELLTRAWRPATPEDYALSPPSFRLPRMTHELIPRTPATSKAHALWSQQVSATVGADMAERLSLHIAHTVWYMAVRDARRPYTRPAIMAQYCAHILAYLRRWTAHEHLHPLHLLPTAHLQTLESQHSACTSTILHDVFQRNLHQQLTDFQKQRHTSQPFLQVPGVDASSSHGPCLLTDVQGPDLIDAARFVGELARLHVVATPATVEQWLQALFLHEIPWVQVPMHELEAGCALLLLTGSLSQLDMSACTLQEHPTRASIHHQCLCKLEELARSRWIPASSKKWIQVRGELLISQEVIAYGRHGWA